MSNRDLIFNRGYSIVATFQVSRFTMFLFVLAASLSLDLGLLFAASFGLADRVVEQKLTNGLTILMVEHDMRLVMDISDHVIVLNFGEVIARGVPGDMQRNEDVAKAYLGSSEIGLELCEAVAEIRAS